MKPFAAVTLMAVVCVALAGGFSSGNAVLENPLNNIKMKRPNQVVRAAGMGRLNLPNVTVTDQHGKAYQFYDDLVRDKMVMINMFYATCTGICPRMTASLAKVQKALRDKAADRLGKDIFIYSITMKPEEDTREKLRHYSEMHGIEPGSGWLLLRAGRNDMELLRERLGFKESDALLDADINQHTGMVRFGNDKYDKWGGCPLLGSIDDIVEGFLWTDLSLPRRGYQTN